SVQVTKSNSSCTLSFSRNKSIHDMLLRSYDSAYTRRWSTLTYFMAHRSERRAIYEANVVTTSAARPPGAANRETAQSVEKRPDERYFSAPPMTGILAPTSSLVT